MTSPLAHISAISLFVEDLAAAKAFYRDVFRADIVYEDGASVALRFESIVINLLQVANAATLVAPNQVAPPDSGARCQFSVWVTDVDAQCEELRRRGVSLLTGPRDQPWGMRTATFVDPAGHSWEVAQRIARSPT